MRILNSDQKDQLDQGLVNSGLCAKSQSAVAFVKLGTRLFICYLGLLSYYKGRVE